MIVVTAPTGQIGSRVLADLLQHDEPVRVIARDPGKLPARTRDRVDIVQGSHGNSDVVERAFEGADALFWLAPGVPDAPSIYQAYVGFAIPAADAIVHHAVPRVVAVSALGRGVPGYAGHVSATLAMDDLIRSTGAHTRELANPSFMDNRLRDADSIRDGSYSGTLPADLKLPTIATKDIGDAAARLLLDHTWTDQQAVPLLGAEDLSENDVAAILTDVLGRTVRYQLGDRDEDKRTLMQYGMSEPVAQALIDMDLAKAGGLDLSVQRTANNTTPTTFRAWATEILKPTVE